MTRETAIEILKELWRTKYPLYLESDIRKALEMAIQSLEQEPKYCDRNICLRNEYSGIGCDECEVVISREQADVEITDDDIATMRILFNAEIGHFCNQGRHKDAEEMEQIRDRLMARLQADDDAISRQAVIETLDDMDNVLDEDRTIENYKELLKECYEVLPPVKPQEKTGHWIYKTMEGQFCSICDEQSVWKFNYCPYCGVKMVEEQERSDKK